MERKGQEQASKGERKGEREGKERVRELEGGLGGRER